MPHFFFSTIRICVFTAGIRTTWNNTVLKSVFPEPNFWVADNLVCDYELHFLCWDVIHTVQHAGKFRFSLFLVQVPSPVTAISLNCIFYYFFICPYYRYGSIQMFPFSWKPFLFIQNNYFENLHSAGKMRSVGYKFWNKIHNSYSPDMFPRVLWCSSAAELFPCRRVSRVICWLSCSTRIG